MSWKTPPIPPLANELAPALQARIDNKTKPPRSLGRLEEIALRLGLMQATVQPKLVAPHVLVFAGDHGLAREGVSPFPPEVTPQMVLNFLAGGAGINVLARLSNLPIKVIDAGVAHDFGPRSDLIDAKISPEGTRNYLTEAAMTREECIAAIEKGAKVVRQLAAEGCNVLVVGEVGIGNTASASLLTHVFTRTPLVDCVGRGTGLNDEGLARKRALLAQAVERAKLPADADAVTVLAEFGGFEIAMMAGALLAGAECRMTLLIDGFIATSALLVASRIAPNIREYCIFCHRSAEPGHQAQVRDLRGEPLLDLGLRLGEGTGATVAYPLVCSALAFLNDMASFDSAGVSTIVN